MVSVVVRDIGTVPKILEKKEQEKDISELIELM